MKKGLLSALLLLASVVAFGQTLINQTWSDTNGVAGDQFASSVTELGDYYYTVGYDTTTGESLLDSNNVDSMVSHGTEMTLNIGTGVNHAYFVGNNLGGDSLMVAGLVDTSGVTALYFAMVDPLTGLAGHVDTTALGLDSIISFGGATVSSDGGMVAAVNYINASGATRFAVAKFNSLGSLLWTMTDSLNTLSVHEEANSIFEASSGKFIISGSADTNTVATDTQAFWSRIPSTGGSIEDFYMYGLGGVQSFEAGKELLIGANNGSFGFAGTSGTGMYLVVAASGNGAIDFTQTFTPGTVNAAYDFAERPSGRFVLVGESDGKAIMQIADSDGNDLFLKEFDNGGTSAFYDVLKTSDNGLMAVGFDDASGDADFFYTYYQFISFDTLSTFAPTCADSANGGATFVVSGGTAPYSYTFNGVSSGASADTSGLVAGTYTVVVTDADSRVDSVTFTIVDPAGVDIIDFDTTNVTCYAGMDGALVVHATGGSGQYKFAIDTFAFQADSSFAGLGAGTYFFSVMDSVNGCIVDSIASVTLTQPDSLVLVTDSTVNVSCNGGADGYIELSFLGGGSDSVTYFWDSVSTGFVMADTSVFENLGAGLYRFYANDTNGCSSDTLDITLTEAGLLSVTANVTINESCYQSADGSISTTFSGGTPPLTYLWVKNGTDTLAQTTSAVTGLDSGLYVVYATDSLGCTDTTASTITGQDEIVISIDTTVNVACYGDTSGYASVTVSGGFYGGPGYAFIGFVDTLSGDTVASVIDALTLTSSSLYAGVFYVDILDDNGCVEQDTFTITQPNALTLSLLDSNVTCFKDTNGVIYPTVTGGLQPYTFSWTDTSGTFTSSDSIIDNLMAGRYILTLTDSNGCTIIDSADVSAADTLNVSGVVTNLVGCAGGDNGEIDVTVTGGTPYTVGAPYMYAWVGPNSFTATTEDIDSLEAGAYTLTVTDSTGCDSVIVFNVIDGSTAVASVDTIANVSCFGGADGEVKIILTGGNPAYAYNWSNGSTDSTLTGVGAGNYWLVVTDQVGCLSDTLFVTVTEPAVLAISSLTFTPNDCYGDTLAAISMTVVGGTPYTVGDAYSYSWTSASGFVVEDSLSPDSLIADSMFVTVTDTLGCTVTDTIVVMDPAVISAAVDTVINVTCAGDSTGSIMVTVTGGTPALAGYTYAWVNTLSDTVSTDEDLVNMPSGTYFFAMMDSLSCLVWDTLAIGQNSYMDAGITIDSVSCYGLNDGVIAAVAVGGVPYTVGEPYLYTWVTGLDTVSDSASANELFAGTYYLTVTDSLGCTFLDTIVVPQPVQITFTADVDSLVGCYTAFNGAIDVTVFGGVPADSGFAYSWTGPSGFTSSDEDLTALYRGTYNLQVTDSLGCVVDTFFVVGHPDFWSNTASDLTDVVCNGDSTGSVVNTVAGGTPPYTYAWWLAGTPGDTIATTQSLTDLPAGNYKFAVEDFMGCDTTFTFVIGEPAALAGSYTTTTVLCYGDSSGTIDATITGGTAPYTYSWAGPSGFTSADSSLTGLGGGTYYLTVTDDTSCVFMDTVEIEQPDTALYLTKVVTDITYCYGSSTGSIDITPLGGALNYTYAWTGPNAFGSTNQDISGLVAGTYYLTLTDTNGCSIMDTSVILNAVSPVDLVIVDTVHVLCNGDSTGSAKVIATGGTGKYTYYWFNALGDTVSFDSTLVGMPAGDYSLFVEDSLGCDGYPNPALLTITEPAALSLTAAIDSVKCFGESNGSVDLTVTGGVAPYTYDWNTGTSMGQDTVNVIAGTYSVVVTDANGCMAGASYTVFEPAILAIAVDNVDSVSCNGGSDGAIQVSVTGGTGAYTYAWDNGATTDDISGLTAGTYKLMVTDANGCQDSVSVTVYEPAALAMTVSITPPTCNGDTDGAIDITVTGGTLAYTYSWTGDATTSSEDLTGLNAGTYMISVTDANGCTLDSTIEVVEPPVLTVTVDSIHDVSCKGGSDGAIFITAAGGNAGYTYAWSDASSSEDRTGLTAGTYKVIVTDAKGCQDSVTVIVSEPASALNVTEEHINVACYGDASGSINITVTGGTSPYTYAWSNGATSQDLSGLLGDSTYTVVVTDANGCNFNLPVYISQPDDLLAPIAKLDVFPCYDGRTGKATVSPVGGVAPYQVIWSNMPFDTVIVNNAGSHLNDSLFAGTYGVTVIDANGCIETNAVILTQPTEVVATATVVSNISCFGAANGAASVSVTGGTTPYEYEWMHNGATTSSINGLAAGTYTVIVNDFYGCSDQVSVTITAPAELVATIVGTDVSCFGAANGSAVLTVQGGTTPYTYNWGSFGTTKDLSGLNPGTYSVIVTDGNNCTATASVTIGQPASAMDVSVGSFVNVSCNGQSNGSVDLIVNGGVAPYNYVWSNGETSQDLSNLAAGTYTVTVTDANGCGETTSVTITQPVALTATIAKTDVQCSGTNNGSLDLILNGGTAPFTYSWSNGATSQDVSGLAAGPYLVTVTDANGCSVTASATISAPQAISTSVAIVNVTCNGGVDGRIDQTVTGGTAPYSYVWNHGAITEDLNTLSAGTYTVVISDANGCSVTRSYTVAQFDPLQVTVITTDVECFGETDGTAFALVSGGSGTYSFIWNTGSADQFITGLGKGNFTVTVTDGAGCSISATETVASPAAMVLSIDKTDETAVDACNGEADLTVTGGTAPYTYAWTNGQTIQDITALCPGVYTVTVEDANNCQASIGVAINTFIGLEEVDAISDVKVYPNPTTGLAFVEFNATQEMDVTVVVTDMTGAFMMAKEVKTTFGNFKMEIDMNDYAKGIYLVNVKSVEGMITKRIAVQ